MIQNWYLKSSSHVRMHPVKITLAKNNSRRRMRQGFMQICSSSIFICIAFLNSHCTHHALIVIENVRFAHACHQWLKKGCNFCKKLSIYRENIENGKYSSDFIAQTWNMKSTWIFYIASCRFLWYITKKLTTYDNKQYLQM